MAGIRVRPSLSRLDLAGQFFEEPRDDPQDAPPRRRQMVLAPSTWPGVSVGLAAQPSVRLHPPQHRIQRSGADRVAVLAQLVEHPLADNGVLGGMMQDVDLPEAQQDLAMKRFSRSSL